MNPSSPPQFTADIDKSIPIPPRGIGGGHKPFKYPVDRMEVGDSYFVECASRQERVSAASAPHKWGKRNGRTFTTRRVENGIRVWRIG